MKDSTHALLVKSKEAMDEVVNDLRWYEYHASENGRINRIRAFETQASLMFKFSILAEIVKELVDLTEW